MDAKEFDKTAREIYAPAYSENAKQILAYAGITKGSCIDLGCGPGYLGLALAQMSELNFCLIDKDPEMLEIAQQNIFDRGLESRASKLLADSSNLPLEDNSVQLVVSRVQCFTGMNRSKHLTRYTVSWHPLEKLLLVQDLAIPGLNSKLMRSWPKKSPDGVRLSSAGSAPVLLRSGEKSCRKPIFPITILTTCQQSSCGLNFQNNPINYFNLWSENCVYKYP